jgi:formylglycine-generating enzyme required for sulfatase activity
MVRVQGNVSSEAYCIDRTEVTNAEYALFLDSATVEVEVVPVGACAFNTSRVPTALWPPSASENSLPVVFVDWCDAAAYCEWAGKRLCGRVGGGPIPYDNVAAPDGEWYRACSAAGDREFPYGDAYQPNACNGLDYGEAERVPVGTIPACQGGYSGLYDMSGNVFEWDDSCAGSDGASDSCRVRGGSYENVSANLRCDNPDYAHRQDKAGHIGIRCCANAN